MKSSELSYQLVRNIEIEIQRMNAVSSHRKKSQITKADWVKLSGVNCPTCGKELLKTYGPLKQCRECLTKLKDIMLEETVCPKCSEKAAKATVFSNGLLDEKILCPRCGTFSIVNRNPVR